MGFFGTLVYSVGLAMDACAVGMTNGMTDTKMPAKRALLIGLFFGFFQFLMPLIGYYVTGIIASAFLDTFKKISAWISFGLLAFLGGKMLLEGIAEWREARNPSTDGCENCETVGACTRLTAKEEETGLPLGKLFMQAIATSIDALAVGVTLQTLMLSEEGLLLGVWGSTAMIGVVTFALSVGAVYIGKAVGGKLTDKAEILGGVVLLAIGLKILLGSF
ncbi:MAG: manganese efflux pump [Clostridia bacterium]|nr:manganese efflux pump [Clostridia bacterium]